MKASVDEDRCRGHGVCLGLCPEVFSLTDDGYAEVTVSDIPAEYHDAVHEAVRNCPENAITVE